MSDISSLLRKEEKLVQSASHNFNIKTHFNPEKVEENK
jgi:hypothetical protein